jgi:hypothetical protein
MIYSIEQEEQEEVEKIAIAEDNDESTTHYELFIV